MGFYVSEKPTKKLTHGWSIWLAYLFMYCNHDNCITSGNTLASRNPYRFWFLKICKTSRSHELITQNILFLERAGKWWSRNRAPQAAVCKAASQRPGRPCQGDAHQGSGDRGPTQEVPGTCRSAQQWRISQPTGKSVRKAPTKMRHWEWLVWLLIDRKCNLTAVPLTVYPLVFCLCFLHPHSWFYFLSFSIYLYSYLSC